MVSDKLYMYYAFYMHALTNNQGLNSTCISDSQSYDSDKEDTNKWLVMANTISEFSSTQETWTAYIHGTPPTVPGN